MQLIDARDAARLKNIQALYLAAFPAAERKSFSMILKKQAEGSVDILSIEEDDGRFLGLAILAHAGDLSLLDYFAVSPESRGKGTGGAAFELLKARHANRRFFLEIEDVSVPSDNAEQRLRRRAFYLRHGACARCPSKQSCSACAWKFSPREPRSRLRNTIPCTQAYSAPSAKTASASPRPARNSPSPPLARTRRLRGDFPAKHKCGPRGFSFRRSEITPLQKGLLFFGHKTEILSVYAHKLPFMRQSFPQEMWIKTGCPQEFF